MTGYYEPARGQRLHNAALLESLSVLGAAPPLLARLAQRAYEGPRGLTVAMKNGLLVYFGDSSRPHAKWLSLARVLADKSSAGALYVDVRLPERPAAGMSSETIERDLEQRAGKRHRIDGVGTGRWSDRRKDRTLDRTRRTRKPELTQRRTERIHHGTEHLAGAR